jgi:GcrA cell cycle regulator
MIVWDDARIAELTRLWSDSSLSASKIAKQMGVPSRCAIIGKARRLGLPSRMTSIYSMPVATDGEVMHYRIPKPKPPKIEAQPMPEPKPATIAVPEPRTAPIPLSQAGYAQCRAPAWGDDGDRSWPVCGAATDGGSFCPEHRKQFYQPMQKRVVA